MARRPAGVLAFAKQARIGARDLPLGEALRHETALFVGQFSNADVVERGRAVQSRYDAGADSYEAFGIPRD